MNVSLYENVIKDIDSYVCDVINKGFEDIQIGEDLFKNVRQRGEDELVRFLLKKYPNFYSSLNFVRKSPEHQIEPNFIHTDEMMGDLTAILYLNYNPPKEDGTTLYYKGEKSCILKSKLNRLIVFPSHLEHSRNIFENFGDEDNESRLIHVCFLKKNTAYEQY
jgi:hypothetical protein